MSKSREQLLYEEALRCLQFYTGRMWEWTIAARVDQGLEMMPCGCDKGQIAHYDHWAKFTHLSKCAVCNGEGYRLVKRAG